MSDQGNEVFRILLVGSRGFLGSELRRQLKDLGIHIVDVTSQQPMAAISDASIAGADAVIWAASGVTPAVAAADPALAEAELEYFAHSIDRIQRTADSPRIVLASSGGTVYDESSDPPYSESSPTGARSPYAAMKLAMEELTAAAGGTSARISNLYGVGQPARKGLGVISYWLRAVAEGAPLLLYGDSSASRDYLEVADAATALVAMALAPNELPKCLNVGSGTPTSLEELLHLVQSVVSPIVPTVDRVATGRSFDRLVSWLDISLIRTELGWAPQTPLPDGLRRAWESLRPA